MGGTVRGGVGGGGPAPGKIHAWGWGLVSTGGISLSNTKTKCEGIQDGRGRDRGI